VIEKQNEQKKHNISLNASKNLNPQFKIDTRLQYSKDDVQNRTLRNLNANSPMATNVYLVRSIAIDDLKPWKDANGASYSLPFIGYENPYWNIYENYNEDTKSRFIGGLTATIGITEFLKFRGQISSDLSNGSGLAFIEKGGIASPTGSYRNFTQDNKIWNTEGLFMYDQKFSDFSITANFGGNLRSSNAYRTTAAVSTLAEQNVMNLSNAAGFIENDELLTRAKVNSLYGSTNFGYKNYLYLDLTARNDWSSTLPKSNWSFFYPSASLSYVISDALKLPKAISLAKIRGSIARVGNDADPYNLFSSFNYSGSFNGLSYVTFDNVYKNQNLKPEITTSTELGLDLDFFNRRLTLNGTVYKSSTVNQIFSSLVPSESGFSRSILNAGEIENKGIELSLLAKVFKGKRFSWDLN
jgi:outer membrane receptor protein involved in Fe transport